MKKVIVITISILSIILSLFIVYILIQNKKMNNVVETSSMINNSSINEIYMTNEVNSIDEKNNINEVSNDNVKNKPNQSTVVVINKAENKKDKKDDKIYKKVNETVYAITTVYIREKDDIKSNTITELSLGDVLKRTAIGSNGWSKVEYNGKNGYINTKYISTKKPPEAKEIELNVNHNRKIDSSKPMVALTFDDGPNPNSTPKILKTLEKYKCVATFFDLGTCMKKYPKITKKEEEIGCEVGSHTYAHKNLDNLSKKEILEDIKMSEDIYKETLGHDLTLVRPPYGNANSTVKLALDYPLINWDVDTEDWKSKDKNAIIKQIKKVGNLDGKVILMHSIYNATADAIEEIVPQLLKQGYQLVTISELAEYKQVKLKTHTCYWGLK